MCVKNAGRVRVGMKAKPGELRNVVGNSGVVAIKECTIINNVVGDGSHVILTGR